MDILPEFFDPAWRHLDKAPPWIWLAYADPTTQGAYPPHYRLHPPTPQAPTTGFMDIIPAPKKMPKGLVAVAFGWRAIANALSLDP
eukprot:6795338-Pyramimonas_sp.AAC.1